MSCCFHVEAVNLSTGEGLDQSTMLIAAGVLTWFQDDSPNLKILKVL